MPFLQALAWPILLGLRQPLPPPGRTVRLECPSFSGPLGVGDEVQPFTVITDAQYRDFCAAERLRHRTLETRRQLQRRGGFGPGLPALLRHVMSFLSFRRVVPAMDGRPASHGCRQLVPPGPLPARSGQAARAASGGWETPATAMAAWLL